MTSRAEARRTSSTDRAIELFNSVPSTSNHEIFGGKPIIKGTRISVEFVLELYASGASKDEILHNYPHLSEKDIHAALSYATRFLKNEIVLELDTV